jgi:hypothetical protein
MEPRFYPSAQVERSVGTPAAEKGDKPAALHRAYSCDLSTSRSRATICRLDCREICSAHFISIEGSSVRLGYSRNIPDSTQCVASACAWD